MRKITAKGIFSKDGSILKDQVILVSDHGKIIDIVSKATITDHSSIEQYDGILSPGFINTHCHLELSHMKDLVDTGTGLIPFISAVVKYRDFPEEVIQEAIKSADKEMWNNGIVAVGDISNKVDTANTKNNSLIAYYTFVEMFDFLNTKMTQSTYDNYKNVFENQANLGLNKKSFVPHAPYTVSPELFELIKSNSSEEETISIHNQETFAENQLFLNGNGAFMEFYQNIGMPLNDFQFTGKSAIHYAMNHMTPNSKTLFVHNTMTSENDIQEANSWSDKVYWATCPNANLYIENKLPEYHLFLNQNAKMTIGTDSLTSNWQLNIASEILSIQKYCSYVSLDDLLTWATINGAEALGYNKQFGKLEIGKSPGILLLDADLINERWKLKSDAVRRLC